MDADFDLEGLARDLAAFRDGVSFHLTNEPPIPADISERLWTAHNAVVAALDELKTRYGYPESRQTVYAPERVRDDE